MMEKRKDEKNDNDDNDDIVEEVSTMKKQKNKRNKKLLKKQRDAELRKRNLGIGVGKIDTTTSSSNKKIIFNDDDDDPFTSEGNNKEPSDDDKESKISKVKENNNDNEDDDAVEEVKASDARETILEQMAVERETKRVEKIMTKKSKKKSKKKEEDLGDEFLSMLDTEQELDRQKQKEERKQLRKKRNISSTIATHTTFVSEEDGVSSTNHNGAIDVNYNLQVVVLPNTNNTTTNDDPENQTLEAQRQSLSIASTLGTKPSKAALLYSRENLGEITQDKDDKDVPRGRKRKVDEQFWKRSNKRTYGFDNKRVGQTAFQFSI